MNKILGVGNALVDNITFLNDDGLLKDLALPKGSMQLVDVETSRRINKRTDGLSKHFASGGSAANTIYGLAKLDVPSGFIGAVGPDEMGAFFKKDMERAGIITYMMPGNQQTGQAISLVSKDGERTFATYLGAAVEINPKGLAKDYFSGYDHLHLEGYLVQDYALVNTAVKLAKEYQMTVSIDLASYNVVENHLEFLHNLLKDNIDIVFANEVEAHAFTSGKDPEKAVEDLASLCSIAVVKTGEKGSLVMQDGTMYRIKAIDARCLDTTGAGDLYASGFLFGMVKGLGPAACGMAGSLLAGKVIEEPGAKISQAGWENVFYALSAILQEG